MTVNDLIKLNGNFEITNDTNSHSRDTGSLITDGGIGIEKNLNVGEDFNALGISTVNNLRVTGLSTFTGLMDIDGGAEIGALKIGITTANMLGTIGNNNLIIDSAGGTTTIQDNVVVSGDFSSSGATNGNIRIGVTNDNEIDTSSGNLSIDSAGGNVIVDDNLSVTGNILATQGSYQFDNVRINGNEIDTPSGNLTIDSTGGTVIIDDNLNVTGNINLTGSFTGASVTFSGNLTAAGATLGNVQVGLADNQTVTTSSGKLVLDAATNEVEINADIDHNGNLNTSGTGTFGGNLSVTGSGTFTGDVIAFSSSDLTMKENVSPIDNALDMISSLTGNTFDWKSSAGNWGLEGGDTGIIAQEVEKLKLPGLTKTRGDGTIGVRYDRLIPVLIEAIKELKSEINELKK